MPDKKIIYIFLFVGSTIGSIIPGLLGAGMFSLWGMVFSAVGGLAGIWLGYKVSVYLE